MAELEILNHQGQVSGKLTVPPQLAEAQVTVALAHRVIVAEEANRRQGTQSAKTRSEVRGGGRKPYRQKKTGRARQGTIRSPLFTHGGMALAVKPRSYDKKVNKKERRAALIGAFAAQLAGGHVIVTENLAFPEPKTRTALSLLDHLGLADTKRVLVIVPTHDEVTHKSFRNLPNVTLRTAPSRGKVSADSPKTAAFSTRDVLVAHKIVVTKDAFERLQEVWAE
jgi:large subunit ribosomal protein L4